MLKSAMPFHFAISFLSQQLRHWQWLLDTALPGEFGQIGEWLNQGEALINSDDIPTQLNEEAAAVLNQKIEDHKSFFSDYASVQSQFGKAMASSPLVGQMPRAQLESMADRLKGIGHKADVRAVRLKFLEHKVSTEIMSCTHAGESSGFLKNVHVHAGCGEYQFDVNLMFLQASLHIITRMHLSLLFQALPALFVCFLFG